MTERKLSACDAIFEAAARVEDGTIELNIFRNALMVLAKLPEPDIMEFVECLSFMLKEGHTKH